MSLPPHLPVSSNDEYVHIRCLVANLHKPRNVSRPPVTAEKRRSLEVVREIPSSTNIEHSGSISDRLDNLSVEEVTPTKRPKSNSIAGSQSLAPPIIEKKRRTSFLQLHVGGAAYHPGPLSAGTHLAVPRFTVTAPPGEQQRRHSNAFAAFHGFALRRHSNTSLHRSESMVSLACFKTLQQLVNNDSDAELQQYLANNKNIHIDDRDENGTTALMCSCESGRTAAVRLLLGAHADPNAADADGWTPLAFAARFGHLDIVKELLDAGARVDPRDCAGWTPLMWASYKGHEDVVACLLESGADVHAHENYNINSLVWAAGRKHNSIVKRLLAAGARPNSCDKYATSALTWAARAGDVASCADLLAAGADPNTAGMYCWTPLLQATQGNHFEIVQMLLEHKPNVNALDKDGCTALAIACKEGYYDIALALINSGAYINVQDHSKDTPLINAVKGGHKNIVEALLKKHVDVDLPGKDKKTPVYTAVEKGHVAVLKLLLASNPDLEHCTVSGDTPLLRAVRSRNAEMVQLLLERKARVNAADNRGDTALHIAMRARSKQIVEILLRNPKHSQLLYKPNKQNETPYNIDMSYNKTILGQIFGARKLNTNEDNENMLGYELYSSALADMLSEPSLSVPITVGLYARWGSGKSFLLNKLKEEMKNFARQWSEIGWTWSWAVSWAAWHVALSLGACAAIAGTPTYVAVAVCFGLFAAIYLALYVLWYLGNRYEWWWTGGVMSALGRNFSSLLLVLQVVFCHPPGPHDPRALPATPIRFHFTEGMKSGGGQEGEAMVVQMVASLAEALECQYGRVCCRLTRAFRPKPVSSTSGWKWRRMCCVPHIITFEICFTCILLGLCIIVMYLNPKDEYPIESGSSSIRRRDIHQGLMYGACALGAVIVLANLYTWGRVLTSLVLPPRTRLARSLKKDAPTLALRPEVQTLTDIVSCLDAFTGQQTRLVVVVDALDSCEQEKVLVLLNAVHALCSDPKSPFILLLAIDPHIISKVAWMEAVEINSRRAFSESNIGGWDYLRNMVQLPFYLQNSALRRVKTAQAIAIKRMQVINSEDFSTSLQRSVSARRLSSTSEVMSSQERIKNQSSKDGPGSNTAAARARRLRPSDSVASSIASGLHRASASAPAGGAADLGRVLLTDDYFSDVNPRSMRRLMNVLYVTGRLLKAFQVEFNWYQLASWVNLTEQWPFRTSWIIYHHETYEEHIDDTTSLKHIYDKVKPLMTNLREAGSLMELDRDERKLEVFLSFHRSTLTAADLKIFLPFTINLDPYIKKVIKEEQMQSGVEEDLGAGGAAGNMIFNTTQQRHPHSKLFQRKNRISPPHHVVPTGPVAPQPMWVGWANTGSNFFSQALPSSYSNMHQAPQAPPPPPLPPPLLNPYQTLKTAFPSLVSEGDVANLRLSTMSIERVCSVVRAALGSGATAACDALQQHKVSGLALSICQLSDLKPILDLPFGDWELFQLLINNLRELEANMPTSAPAVNVIPEKPIEIDSIDASSVVKQRPVLLEQQRSRPSNVEKQVTLEEQMICGALQTLNEEAMEDVLQSEPPSHPDEASELQLQLRPGGGASLAGSAATSPAASPRAPRKDFSILKSGSAFRARHPPAVTFNVENEEDSDDEGQITFSVRPHPAQTAHYRAPQPALSTAPRNELPTSRSRPSSLLVASEDTPDSHLYVRSMSVEDSTKTDSPIVDLKRKNLRKTAELLRKVSSAERLSRLKDKIIRGSSGSRDRSPAREEGSDDESVPLVASVPSSPATNLSRGSGSSFASQSPPPQALGVEIGDRSLQDVSANSDVSPRSDLTELESPRTADFDVLPEGKSDEERGGACARVERVDSSGSVSNMVEPYNMRLLSRGASDARYLWRQDALESGPPWPWDEPDSAV
ncbi:kinase D-interacting substrate of 220 kDa B isoform X4 [Hyposmocoma kahamanoa]|uniref:kinase D-interacting substrate of 220 kDa B isoform X4 n=1 Tax=Hyposmocoma kahamanoa TaxID=1477025 RepID=UPI000E6D859A|nr:kinase D-interacting substrate of 220 kDa B isoform X4 [Hyposmocoma kahamanoa]